MRLSIRIIFLFLFLIGPQAFSQYTDLINTNRPGLSQGAFSVGRDVYQLELGFGYGKEKHNLLETKTTGMFAEYALRVGLITEELEFNLTGSFLNHDIEYYNLGYSHELSNFKSNTLGVKYLIYDPYIKRVLEGPNLYSWRKNNRFQLEDLIPAISFYAGANFDTADNPFIYEDKFTVSPKLMIITQNNWIGGWVFVTNLIADRMTTEFPSYEYILTLTRTMRTGTSVFIENHGIFSDFYADQILRFGVAQLINPNLHIDASLQVNFKDTPTKTYGRIGLAYRLDRHSEDDYIEEKKSLFGAGNKLKKERKRKNKQQRMQRQVEESSF
ncbi:MAG TPA: transporter [Flavobacteriaceae bacterium]|nr:transporter [Flavobacteriaceae bacterium]